MPTYEYECRKCGRFEMYLGVKESPLRICPTCGGEVKKLFSPNVNFIFKGGGFYATEYRSPEYKKKEKEEKQNTEKTLKDKKGKTAGDNGKDKQSGSEQKKAE